ncbi:hypothetical protein diail_9657 [Diaporthe ilicicola]|nr:hypothetical protein diail_9657 [Diaporthe ilicicola]
MSPAGSNDSFCIAQQAVSFDTRRQKLVLDCLVQKTTSEEVESGVVRLAELNSYQYLTGPKYLLKQWLYLRVAEEVGWLSLGPFSNDDKNSSGRDFVLLVKREVDGNIFHNMNEIMAIMITLDVLRMTPDPTSTSGAAMFSPEDITNTQIVILDEHPDGPLFDLFGMFSSKKPLRLKEWIAIADVDANTESSAIHVENVILPLAGAANNLWGRLHHSWLAQAVDFAVLPFREQIQLSRDSDVLVGMHGAGLTQAMFMEEGRGAVVDITVRI